MKQFLEGIGAIALERSRLVDFVALTKPELTLLSVLTAMAGFFLGSSGPIDGSLLFNLLAGTALVGGGAGALNQLMERDFDAMMHRTENRPLPAGRVTPQEALTFGICLVAVGWVEIALFVNFLTALLAGLTCLTYLFLYTPMKRVTPAATLVGAIPGAIPPMMGWAAARNELSGEAWILFAILFLWQIPHFLSLAWMYRRDYARAGYRLLTVADEHGRRTSSHILGYTLALLILSALPGLKGGVNFVYLSVAVTAGLAFVWLAVDLVRTRSNASAKRVFLASLIYLPLLMALLVANRF